MLSDPTRRIRGAISNVFPPAVLEAYRRVHVGRGVETLSPTGYLREHV